MIRKLLFPVFFVLCAGCASATRVQAFDEYDLVQGRATAAQGIGSRIVGTWVAQVTLLDCSTRQPLQAPPFRAIVVFQAGGTVSEASGPSVRRTPSFGNWRWTGRSSYYASSILLTYDANGAFTGDQSINRLIELAPDGRRFLADTETVGRDAAGNTQFRGCARGEASRVE